MTKVQESISEMAKDLHAIGAIDKITLRKFDPSILPAIPNYSATQISSIRKKSGLSQGVFALYLNVSDRAVKKWERGEAKPTGATLKLLSLIETKGIEIMA